jgi:tRNA A37 methylthiotransferase MiaB
MKLWIDDVRPKPDDSYIWSWSVNRAKQIIQEIETMHFMGSQAITLLDIDHDAGDFAKDGGDYIKLLDWLEETGRNYPIRIHSMNPVGRENMRAIIRRNGWKEVM